MDGIKKLLSLNITIENNIQWWLPTCSNSIVLFHHRTYNPPKSNLTIITLNLTQKTMCHVSTQEIISIMNTLTL